jgi:hypothetical protein
VIMIPFGFVPLLGIAVSAALKALGTGEYLHRRVSIPRGTCLEVLLITYFTVFRSEAYDAYTD